PPRGRIELAGSRTEGTRGQPPVEEADLGVEHMHVVLGTAQVVAVIVPVVRLIRIVGVLLFGQGARQVCNPEVVDIPFQRPGQALWRRRVRVTVENGSRQSLTPYVLIGRYHSSILKGRLVKRAHVESGNAFQIRVGEGHVR